MNKYLFLFLLSFVGIHFAEGQNNLNPVFVKKITGSFSYFKRDESGNVFAITSTGQLKKYNANLDSMGVFNDIRSFGYIDNVTSINSLRTLLFCKQFRLVLLLDRLMQVVNKINLSKIQVFQVQAVTQSYDNNIWLFDEQENKLKKISEAGKLIFESADLRLVFSEAIVPNAIFDHGGFVYLYDPLKGLFIFDYYGALKNKIALLGWRDIQFVGNGFFGKKDNKILVYKPGELNISEINIPAALEKALKIQFSSLGCMALFEDGIYSFQWDK